MKGGETGRFVEGVRVRVKDKKVNGCGEFTWCNTMYIV